MHGIVYAKGAKFVQSAKEYLYFCLSKGRARDKLLWPVTTTLRADITAQS